MISTFPNTKAGEIAAFAVAAPRSIAFVRDHWEVGTEGDYQAPQPQDERTYTETQVRTILVDAGVISDDVEAALRRA